MEFSFKINKHDGPNKCDGRKFFKNVCFFYPENMKNSEKNNKFLNLAV